MKSQTLLLPLSSTVVGSVLPDVVPRDDPLALTIDWTNVLIESKTSLTLQAVVNPPLLDGSDIHDEALKSLQLVSSDYVRFVPWFPYPVLGVVELEPPVTGDDGSCSTSWNFTYSDQLLGDFLNNTQGVKHIINYSTTPDWMWVSDSSYSYNPDPNYIDWSYNNGTQLRDSTFKEVSDYYARLISWYAKGGFTDECGVYHESGYNWPIEMWEVLNEMDSEHQFQQDYYNKFYDAVTTAIHAVNPDIEFVGLALSSRDSTWVESFLNADNHAAGTPLDWISYHFYASPGTDTTQNEAAASFQQADQFFGQVQEMEAARIKYNPNAKTTIDELGTMDPQSTTTIVPGYEVPEEYWNWSGGIFAYCFSHLLLMGIDVVGESQLVGYPGQYPSVSLVYYQDGTPTARLRTLQLLQSTFGPGDKAVNTTADETQYHAQAFISAKDGKKRILLVNKLDQDLKIISQQALHALPVQHDN